MNDWFSDRERARAEKKKDFLYGFIVGFLACLIILMVVSASIASETSQFYLSPINQTHFELRKKGSVSWAVIITRGEALDILSNNPNIELRE